MSFTISSKNYKVLDKSDSVYYSYGPGGIDSLFGCGFLCKKGVDCTEIDNVYQHYGIVIVLRGSAVQYDENGKATDIYPGCLIQRIPGKKQTLIINPDSNWLEFFVCISKKMYEALTFMDLLSEEQDVLYSGINMALMDECRELLHEMKQGYCESRSFLPKVIEFILKLHDMHKQHKVLSRDIEIVEYACVLLLKPENSNYSIKEVASRMGIGYEKFRKIFKLHTGISPRHYVMHQRINIAKQLLQNNKISIKEVSMKVGFSDQYAFSKQFRRSTGMSPSQFRQTWYDD